MSSKITLKTWVIPLRLFKSGSCVFGFAVDANDYNRIIFIQYRKEINIIAIDYEKDCRQMFELLSEQCDDYDYAVKLVLSMVKEIQNIQKTHHIAFETDEVTIEQHIKFINKKFKNDSVLLTKNLDSFSKSKKIRKITR